MASSSGELHEAASSLRQETIERHRAVVSLMEELEAMDWYDQRIDASTDESLRAILAHNRDEEKEHAVMTLEWLRRGDPVLDGYLRRYLFSEGPITELEEEPLPGGPSTPSGGADGGASSGGAAGGIGSLRDKEEL